MNLPNTNPPELAPYSPAGRHSCHDASMESENAVFDYSEVRQFAQLLIRDRETLRAISPEKIDFIEALGDYIQINADGKGYLKAQRLAELKAQLDPALFLEVHPTCLVNVARLPNWDEVLDDGWTLLTEGSLVPVSSEGRNAILRMWSLARR